jgi:hypothetical protein
MLKKIGVLLTACCLGPQAWADDAEIYVSDESLQGRFVTGADLIGLQTGNLGFEAFINEEDDLLGAVSLDFIGAPAGSTQWVFSAGPKLYLGSLDIVDDSFIGVAAGASASYAFEYLRPLWVTGQFYYAPKITTAGDADDLMDLILRLETQFVDQVTGFLGYRLFEADLENGEDYELDDNIHLGMRISF